MRRGCVTQAMRLICRVEGDDFAIVALVTDRCRCLEGDEARPISRGSTPLAEPLWIGKQFMYR